jgi:hypothetical protein
MLALGACAGADADPARDAQPIISFEEFRALAYREPDTGVYIVDGDIPAIDEAELRALYKSYVTRVTAPNRRAVDGVEQSTSEPLIVNRVLDSDDKWPLLRQINIDYCVSTSFGANHTTVVNAMLSAANEWHLAADVNFQYRPDQDATCDANNAAVTFDVRPTSGNPFFARAFFPSSPRAVRNILIDAQSFGAIAPFTLTGVLRHEVGHTLGFRHEHTRPEASPRSGCFEDTNWRVLTGYDASSVMFNPSCGGNNRGDLVLTQLDKQGVAALYGPPPDRGLDVVFYQASFPDLQSFGSNFAAVRNHYTTIGLREGRRGSGHFDAIYYLANNPDLAATFGADNYPAAFEHWLNFGIAEGRRGSREFDVRHYLRVNPELGAFFGTNYAAALDHWIVFGMYEGRRGSADFDVKFYLSTNADLQVFGTTNYPAALAHWIQTGMKEGRRGAP